MDQRETYSDKELQQQRDSTAEELQTSTMHHENDEATTVATRRKEEEEDEKQPWSPEQSQPTIESVAALEVSFGVAYDTDSLSENVCQKSLGSRIEDDGANRATTPENRAATGEIRAATSSRLPHHQEKLAGTKISTTPTEESAGIPARPIDIIKTTTTKTTIAAASSLSPTRHQHQLIHQQPTPPSPSPPSTLPLLERELLKSVHKELPSAPTRTSTTYLKAATRTSTTQKQSEATSTTPFERNRSSSSAVSTAVSTALPVISEQVQAQQKQSQSPHVSLQPNPASELSPSSRTTNIQKTLTAVKVASFTAPKNSISNNNDKPNNSDKNMSIATMTPPPPKSNAVTSPKKPKKRRSSGASAASTLTGAASPTTALDNNGTTGRWTDEEHATFLSGLSVYGREWKKVAAHIPTRTSAQVRSHAQKFFAKQQRDQADTAYWNAAAVVAQAKQQNLQNANNGSSLSFVVDGVTTTTPMSTTSPATTAAAGAASSMNLDATTQAQHNLQDGSMATAARILAQPESVRAEVEDTLGRLRERYQQLQRQLQDRAGGDAQHHRNDPNGTNADTGTGTGVTAVVSAGTHVPEHDDMSLSVTSAASASPADAEYFSNDEWIALSVLRGALPRGNSYDADSMDMEDEQEQDHAGASPNHHNHANDDSSHGLAAAGDEESRDSTEPSEGSLPKKARLD